MFVQVPFLSMEWIWSKTSPKKTLQRYYKGGCVSKLKPTASHVMESFWFRHDVSCFKMKKKYYLNTKVTLTSESEKSETIWSLCRTRWSAILGFAFAWGKTESLQIFKWINWKIWNAFHLIRVKEEIIKKRNRNNPPHSCNSNTSSFKDRWRMRWYNF